MDQQKNQQDHPASGYVRPGRLRRLTSWLNAFFFLIAGFAAIWLVIIVTVGDWRWRWMLIVFLVLLWAAIAYIFLPRVFRLITNVFVPDYFIGRARTDSGLLGDVVNIAWDGPGTNIHRVMEAAGWTLAQPITLKSSLKIIGSVLFHKPYKAAPVSPLFLFGRKQDFAYQMDVDGSANKRHHIRFWKCPPNWPLPGGKVVGWLSADSFDTGVRLSGFTLQVTHSISGDIDKERDFTLGTVQKVDPGVKISWIEKFSTAFHARNGGGDMVHTDGNLPIVDVETLPASVPDLTAAQKEQIAKADPPPPATIKELREQTRMPSSLLLAALVTIVVAVRDLVDLVLGKYENPFVSALALVVMVLALVAVLRGRSWGRFLLMTVYGVMVVGLFVGWAAAVFQLTSDTEVLRIAVATTMLLVLSSTAVSNYTAAFTKWRQSHRGSAAGR